MNFYEYIIHILSYIFISIDYIYCLNNEDLIVKTGLGAVSPCSVGLKLFAEVNNTSVQEDYAVELVPDQCCLDVGSSLDCDVLEAIGNCVDKVHKGSIATLNLVAPILDPFERKGFCTAYLDSKPVHRKRNVVTMRNVLKIPFDTTLAHKKDISLPFGAKHCKGHDENPLNQCKPVECDVFYNGRKSFYDKIQKRCVEVPVCLSEQAEIPSTVYDPVSNRCIQEDPVTDADVDYIKGLTHLNRNNQGRTIKDIVIIKNLRNTPLNITQIELTESPIDTLTNKGYAVRRKEKNRNHDTFLNSIMYYVVRNKSGVSSLFLIIVFQCGLICTMVYFMARRCMCKKSKKIEKTFFNYRQDASVTTPLIGMTNADTRTTCQFMSDSSHVDRKIQSYKACQKDNKVSLSDDILTKCLNRRNWDRKQVKSDAADVKTVSDSNEGSKTFDTLYVSTRKEPTLNYENDSKKSKEKSVVKKGDSKKQSSKKGENEEKSVSDVHVSEREIQCLTYTYDENKLKHKKDYKTVTDPDCSEEIRCHSYNYGVISSDIDSFKGSSHSYSDVKSTGAKPQVFTTKIGKSNSPIGSIGRQASAQASFSNDSIDDYLSERGMLFLTGENISKYTFSDASLKSSVSGKTSKNNIIKHVLSYLKKDKHGPSSDPGGKKNEEVNLELIHMSKATMYSSSNNDECLKNITRVKDSRTSL